MAWSAENATKAYLRTLKSRNSATEPGTIEFISALAAGNSARLMVEICSGAAGSATTTALLAAAQQTHGRVVCVLHDANQLRLSEAALGSQREAVELVIGDARSLLLDDYVGADFVVIDCNMEGYQGAFRAAKAGAKRRGGLIVCYNAFCKKVWWGGDVKPHMLPIGDGLLLARIPASSATASGRAKRWRWVVQVDECTGEEHIFRVAEARA